MNYYNSKIIRTNMRTNNKAILTIDELFRFSILFYIFSIYFSYSSGEIFVKISRVLVFIVWFFHFTAILKGKVKIRFYYIWGIIFLIYHFCLISFGSIDKSTSMDFLMTVFYTFIVNSIIFSYLTRKPEFLKSILMTVVICSILGALRVFLTYGFSYYFDSRGEEVNANGIGFNCVIGALCAIYLMTKSIRKTKEWYLLIILLLLNLILSALTASRKTYILLGVSCAVYFIFSSKNIFKAFRNICIAIFAVLIVYVLLMKVDFLYNLVGNRIESMISGFLGEDTDASTATRMRLIEYGMEFFQQNQIWGYGLDGFRSLMKIYHIGYSAYYAHNNFIEMLVDGGIVGFIIYYSLYLIIIFKGIKQLKLKNKTVIFFLGIILGLLICEYGMVTYYSMSVHLIIMLCYYQIVIKNTK